LYTENVSFIVIVQIHFIQRKQFSETNVTSCAFQQISNFKLFLNASAGHLKRCGGPHAARGPAVVTHWLNQTTVYAEEIEEPQRYIHEW